jgi:NTP pyrophosphatase (non-canonical NTP hydrolase)
MTDGSAKITLDKSLSLLYIPHTQTGRHPHMKHTAIPDRQLVHLDYLVNLVKFENSLQLEKWGIQTRTPFQWLTYLMEEVGELARAIGEEYHRDGLPVHVVTEAVHVATLALKIAEGYSLPQHRGDKPDD